MLADHFLDAERRGKLGHGLARIDWLATLEGLDPAARPELVHSGAGLRALGRPRRARVPHAGGDLRLPARATSRARPRGRGGELLPHGHARLLGPTAGGRRPRRCADRHVAAAAGASRRRRSARGDDAARHRRAVLRRQAARRRRVDGQGHARRRHRRPRRCRRSRSLRRGAGATRRSRSRRGSQLLVEALGVETHGALLVVARPEADPVPAFRALAAGLRLPGTARLVEQRREVFVLLGVLAALRIELERAAEMCDRVVSRCGRRVPRTGPRGRGPAPTRRTGRARPP